MSPDSFTASLAYLFDSFYKKQWAQYMSDRWKASTQETLGSLATKHILPFFQNKKPDLLRNALQSTLRGMGMHFEQPHADKLHLLRHTSGSLLYRRSGGDPKTTQEWLGHSNSRITADVYVHTQSDQQRRAAEVLCRTLFQPPQPPVGESAN